MNYQKLLHSTPYNSDLHGPLLSSPEQIGIYACTLYKNLCARFIRTEEMIRLYTPPFSRVSIATYIFRSHLIVPPGSFSSLSRIVCLLNFFGSRREPYFQSFPHVILLRGTKGRKEVPKILDETHLSPVHR